MPFPSRGKNNVRDFSSASSFSTFRELPPFKLPFKLLRLLKKSARLMRERERLLFDESATFTRDVMDVQTTAKCATFVTTLEILSREKNESTFTE